MNSPAAPILIADHYDLFEDLWLAQLTAGSARPRLTRYSFAGATLHVQEFPQGVQVRAKVPVSVTAIGCVLEAQSSIVSSGTVWVPSSLAIVSGAEIDVCTHGPSAFAWLELPVSGKNRSTDIVASEAAVRFRQACTQGAFVLSNTSSGRLTTNAGEALLRTAEQAFTCRQSVKSDSGKRRYDLTRRVEEFMWTRVDEPISLKAIGEFCDRGLRTVSYSFQTSYGLGPLSYFKMRRLNAVRDQILSRHADAMIIDVAAEFGFWHLGHFGHDYRLLFGETPSQTRGVSPPCMAG